MSLAIKASRSATQGGVPRGRMVTSGDPGLGGFLKGVARGVGGFLTGGPVGAISAAFGGGGRSIAAPPPRPGPGIDLGRPGGFRLRTPVTRGPVAPEAGTKLACPSGFHPNKSDYFLSDGTFVPKGSKCVKNRRRNPLNPDALRRAVGRIDAGKKWQAKMREIETGKFTKAGKRKSC